MLDYRVFESNRFPRLCDYLYYAMMPRPGVVVCKDGSVLAFYRFRGHDIDSIPASEIVGTAARINNAIKRLGDGWGLWADAVRMPSTAYQSIDTSARPKLVGMTERWREKLFSTGDYYDTKYYLTIGWLPPPDLASRATGFFLEYGDEGPTSSRMDEIIDEFESNVTRLTNILGLNFLEFRRANDDEILSYLHMATTMEDVPISAPELSFPTEDGIRTIRIPMYLDAVLGARHLVGGFIPKVGDLHIKVITVKGYPTDTVPAMLAALNSASIPYRMTLRFIPLDKPKAVAELTSYQKKWFMARKSMLSYMMEALQGTESSKINLDAVEKAADTSLAMQEVQADQTSMGYHTFTIVTWDSSLKELQKKVQTLEKAVNSKGFVTLVETINSTRAWFGGHPGNMRANIRRPLMSSLNFTHLFPSAAVWSGNRENSHLSLPCLFAGVASGSTPFRFNLHVGDVGHTYIVGPTGAGKSVLLNFIELSWLKYPNSKVYVFDKGKSSYVLAKALGAVFRDLKADGSISFQPFAQIDDESELIWAQEWVLDILAAENVVITPEIKTVVWSAIRNMSSADRRHRTFSNLAALIQDKAIRAALEAYTTAGPYGRLFDTTTDVPVNASIEYYEMEELMHSSAAAVRATLTYLFHRLEMQFDGSPTLLVLDEAWTFLDTPQFSARIREWLKVLRKKNVAVVFATQSLADVYESSISSAILDSVATRIFLPNPKATEPSMHDIYHKVGLNTKEIQNLARAQQKRDYYASSVEGSRMFSLDLSPAILAFVAGGGPQIATEVDTVFSSVNGSPERFVDAWLKLKGVGDE